MTVGADDAPGKRPAVMSRAQSTPPAGRGGGADRGSTSLELVILAPAVLLLIFGIVQGALWYTARSVALAAATEGAQAARAVGGSSSDGRTTATSFIARAGQDLSGVRVTADRTQTQASVTVTAHSLSLLPGVPGPSLSQTASGPVERFTSRDNP